MRFARCLADQTSIRLHHRYAGHIPWVEEEIAKTYEETRHCRSRISQSRGYTENATAEVLPASPDLLTRPWEER